MQFLENDNKITKKFFEHFSVYKQSKKNVKKKLFSFMVDNFCAKKCTKDDV